MIDERQWYRVVLPYAVFAIAVSVVTGKVVDAAPIGRWMIGKSYKEVAIWINRKGGKVHILGINEPSKC